MDTVTTPAIPCVSRPGACTPDDCCQRKAPPSHADIMAKVAPAVSVPMQPGAVIPVADPRSVIVVTPTTQALPDDNPKTAFGITKPALSAVPPTALLHLAKAMMDGRRKYGAMNWRDKPVSATIYYDAALRHLMAWFDGEEVAEDSKVHHLGHAMACMAIILDAQSCKVINDDRPTKGQFSAVLKQLTDA